MDLTLGCFFKTAWFFKQRAAVQPRFLFKGATEQSFLMCSAGHHTISLNDPPADAPQPAVFPPIFRHATQQLRTSFSRTILRSQNFEIALSSQDQQVAVFHTVNGKRESQKAI